MYLKEQLMAIIEIHPITITGRWSAGTALDLATTSSTLVGHSENGYPLFETVRPEIAQLLYQLKNKGDAAAAQPIVETTANYLAGKGTKFDVIVPVPPSNVRAVQPVILLATGIGKALNIPVASCISTTRPPKQMKNITDPEERKKHIDGLYAVDSAQTSGRNVLLFDDLFCSGTTMNAIADVLLSDGKAASVQALTITKTRSNQ